MAVQWRHHGLTIRGPSEEDITLAEREWNQASCDYSPHGGIAAVTEDEEEDGPGVGGAMDDEVEEDGEMVEAVEEVLAERDRLEGEGERRAGMEDHERRMGLSPGPRGLNPIGLNPISEGEEEPDGGMVEEEGEGWYTE